MGSKPLKVNPASSQQETMEKIFYQHIWISENWLCDKNRRSKIHSQCLVKGNSVANYIEQVYFQVTDLTVNQTAIVLVGKGNLKHAPEKGYQQVSVLSPLLFLTPMTKIVHT